MRKNAPELTGRKNVRRQVLNVLVGDIEARADDTALMIVKLLNHSNEIGRKLLKETQKEIFRWEFECASKLYLVETAVQENDNLASAVVVDDFELADVTLKSTY